MVRLSRGGCLPLLAAAALQRPVSGALDCSEDSGLPCPLDVLVRRQAPPRITAEAPQRALVPPVVQVPANTNSSSCSEGDVVQCPGAAQGSTCAGKQCCSGSGSGLNALSFVCPSAPAGWNECQSGKRVDCLPERERTERYTCDAMPSELEKIWGWSVMKRKWCCRKHQVGCPSTAAPAEAEEPSKGYHCQLLMDWDMWPAEKKLWCCQQEGVRCTQAGVQPKATTSTTAGSRASCEYLPGQPGANHCPEASERVSEAECRGLPSIFHGKELHNPMVIHSAQDPTGCFNFAEWFYYNTHESGAPKASRTPYCKTCRGSRASAEDSGRESAKHEYDCEKDAGRWSDEWSTWKKMWCCKNEHRGCPHPADAASSTTASSPSTISASTSTPKATRTSSSRTSVSASTTSSASELVEHFDCDEWKLWTWNDEQQQWCCEHRKMGCPVGLLDATTTTPHNDLWRGAKTHSCREPASTWSREKRNWCCKHEHLGCRTDKVAASHYDCKADRDSWVRRWDDAKKDYCCKTERVGCAVGKDAYNCLAGLSEGVASWSSTKRDYCCKRFSLGCENTPRPAYHCSDGSSHLWPRAKREWCCQKRSDYCLRPFFHTDVLRRFQLRVRKEEGGVWWLWPLSLSASCLGLALLALQATRRYFRPRRAAIAYLCMGEEL